MLDPCEAKGTRERERERKKEKQRERENTTLIAPIFQKVLGTDGRTVSEKGRKRDRGRKKKVKVR